PVNTKPVTTKPVNTKPVTTKPVTTDRLNTTTLWSTVYPSGTPVTSSLTKTVTKTKTVTVTVPYPTNTNVTTGNPGNCTYWTTSTRTYSVTTGSPSGNFTRSHASPTTHVQNPHARSSP
ncbi:hypothetical protein BGX27_003988, partial [Mortierella sp. AM989]